MSYFSDDYGIEALTGKVLTSISQGRADGNEYIDFTTSDDVVYRMTHDQDCCENVEIEEIIGDIYALVGDGPVLLAEEASGEVPPTEDYSHDSSTWTFYKLRTHNGDVTIRWLGSSNGYYSEGVSFYKKDAA